MLKLVLELQRSAQHARRLQQRSQARRVKPCLHWVSIYPMAKGAMRPGAGADRGASRRIPGTVRAATSGAASCGPEVAERKATRCDICVSPITVTRICDAGDSGSGFGQVLEKASAHRVECVRGQVV